MPYRDGRMQSWSYTRLWARRSGSSASSPRWSAAQAETAELRRWPAWAASMSCRCG